uniref:Uncharacterized protein n=1 Tax=Equus asinus TaxID=9793 RepID=A0A9L0JJ50_EQUAS
MYTSQALFTIAKTWRQPECPSLDEWIEKMWCMYSVEYCSAVKKNEIVLFVMTSRGLDRILLSEIRQTEKDKYHMISQTNVWI